MSWHKSDSLLGQLAERWPRSRERMGRHHGISIMIVLLAASHWLVGAAVGPAFTDSGSRPARPAGTDDRPSAGIDLPADTLPPTESLLADRPPLGFSSLPPVPADNPLTLEKVELGRRLFFDGILSRDQSVSCASCHQPEFGLATPDPVPIGIDQRPGRRNSPSLFNRAYGRSFFWDGRGESLEHQALQPISDPDEMGDDLQLILQRLADHPEYPGLFAAAFQAQLGDDLAPAAAVDAPTDLKSSPVTAPRLAAALASFQRTLLLGDSPVDRFRAADVKALSLEARQGLWIFESRGRCWQCHSGENFSDEKFHNTGVGYGQTGRDEGRFAVTGDAVDRFAFKTPTLRGVAQTAPYMHDGSVATLEDVVEFYNRGGSAEDPDLTPLLKPLNLSDEEKRFLVEFLKALSPSQ